VRTQLNCLVCGGSLSAESNLNYSADTCFTPGNQLRLVECPKCGFVRNTAFNPKQCQDFYSSNESGYIGATQFSLRSQELALKHGSQLRFIQTFYTRGKWLDLGCCDGALQQYARQQNTFSPDHTEFHSIDLNTKHLCVLGASLSIKFQDGNIESGQFPEGLGDSDLFTLMHVLEHLNDPHSALRNLHQFSKQDSILIIEVPDREGYGFENAPEFWYSLIEHVNHFNLSNLIELTAVCGWEVIRADRYIGRSPGINYPAIIAAFRPRTNFNRVWLENPSGLGMAENNLSQIAKVINIIAREESICLWGMSKFLRLLLPRLNAGISVFDSNMSTRPKNSNVMHTEVAPEPGKFDRVIVTAISSFDSIQALALQMGWQRDKVVSALDLKR
jgi:SAM-dependent methyltransferase